MPEEPKDKSASELSRRAFIESAGAVAALSAVSPVALHAAETGQPEIPAPIAADPAVPRSTISITVNGVAHKLEVEDRWTLVELLRDRLGLTGTKIGCDRGECGACTVLLDGKPVYSCSHLAAWMNGRAVETVESLAKGDRLHPLQEAFIAHDAPQCGFCTSGQIMSAKALLAVNPHPSADDVRAALTGNICRCSNYQHYVEAVLEAAAKGAQA
jgi:xanthine dehydrogenase YagT iron-sulfur-binding subunit